LYHDQSEQRAALAKAHADTYQKLRQQQHEERATVIAKNVTTLADMELDQAKHIARDALRTLEKQQTAELKAQLKRLRESESDMKKKFKHTLRKTEEKFRSKFSTLRKIQPADTRDASKRQHNEELTRKLLELESGHRDSVSDMRHEASTAMATRHQDELRELHAKNELSLTDLKSYQTARVEVQQQYAAQALAHLEQELEEEAAELAAFLEVERKHVAETLARIPLLELKHKEAKALLSRTAKKR
jgi:hypothetical protein